ncbi:olfactory receptor 1-like [Erpetoichthys calabaricus]|uniref:olfactory receptor 1-like n=1 Tax=Erpetoichthys calabaricus TaxID=27687 RepID=UPI002234B65A|nr:olfactory receptor 1-like [Erpetoichthys calabaricus]
MMVNSTKAISDFVLHCEVSRDQRSIATVGLVIVYLATVFGNMLVIVVIKLNHQLHSPMYIFIGTLAVIDLCSSTFIVPKMVAIIQFDDSVILYGVCIAQMYGMLNMELMVTFVLAFMAFDRFVAVIFPLRYPSIVTKKRVLICVLILPVFSFFILFTYLIYATELSFCRTNVLPYCLCDYAKMVIAACNEDPKYLSLLSNMFLALGVCPLVVVLFSYVIIFHVALKIKSGNRNNKVISTCVSHLLVVLLFYIPPLASYVLPQSGLQVTSEKYNLISILSNVIPPMLNPMIYSFKNKDIQGSVYRLFTRKRLAGEPGDH